MLVETHIQSPNFRKKRISILWAQILVLFLLNVSSLCPFFMIFLCDINPANYYDSNSCTLYKSLKEISLGIILILMIV